MLRNQIIRDTHNLTVKQCFTILLKKIASKAVYINYNAQQARGGKLIFGDTLLYEILQGEIFSLLVHIYITQSWKKENKIVLSSSFAAVVKSVEKFSSYAEVDLLKAAGKAVTNARYWKEEEKKENEQGDKNNNSINGREVEKSRWRMTYM